MLAIIIGLVIGILLPIQTSVNSRLRSIVGSPFVASFLSFAVGTTFLSLILLVSGQGFGFDSSIFQQQPIWMWSGGLLGVIFLTGNILLFPRLGSVQTVIMPIFGQIVMGLLIDHFGWFNSTVSVLTPWRVFGALLVLLGVVGTVALTDWINRRRGKFVIANRVETGNLNVWRLLGIGTGMMSAMQTAINGYLGTVLESALKGALVSFVVGIVTLLLVLLILRPSVEWRGLSGQPWWIWLGGIIGALFIGGNVLIVPMVGTGIAVVIVIVGLLCGSLLIDRFGWFGAAKNPVTGIQLVSLLVMVLGIMMIRLS
ncbi:DMT family transporter [Exiguobacterium sp. SH3S2]|uniref:DMT family transporter n=1 Tax=unclassified Exiguobacterium TaxID=2644629 RepID=UPI001039BBFB|nr:MULTISPECIES: DMT family transporter [unclassified Exiguobacterium]TCI42893.1 DMT family transporter [Exiguobacterium sp. SH3S3]TCI58646.1 DMT family transporter [Exiguobacterium sp. SH3S2]TCI61779.1 DMT family transporter [Exiguobacterium sp. SH3S1]